MALSVLFTDGTDVKAVPVDGGAATTILAGINIAAARFDGTRIAYVTAAGDAIHVCDPDGSNDALVLALTDVGAGDASSFAAIAYADTVIAFQTQGGTTGDPYAFGIVNEDGTGEIDWQGGAFDPTYAVSFLFAQGLSPDETQIVADSGGTPGIVVDATDGSGGVTLLDNLTYGTDFGFAWNPDGSVIAFVPTTVAGVWTITPDGATITQLNSLACGSVVWSPGGETLAVVNDSSEIQLVNADGSLGTVIDSSPGAFPLVQGFIGAGTVAVTVTTRAALVFQVTGLWDPATETAAYYGLISDPAAANVEIPLNDSRRASVTVSVYDEIVADVLGHSYARCLKVHYHGELIFWGPIKLNEVTFGDDDTVTFNAVDPSLRLIRHYLRRGDLDGDLNAANQDRATVTIDHNGLRLLRDAALNIPEQTTRGVPDLGIIDGFNDFAASPDDLMGVQRGDQVWNAMLMLSASLGPDFELEPIDDTPLAYARLNTFTTQGIDRSSSVQLHYALGLANLDDLSWTEGEEYTTHVHVLDRNLKYRVTPANLDTSAQTGPYVDWDPTDYDADAIVQADAERVLLAYGQDILIAYSHPLIKAQPVLPIETDDAPRYLRDFAVGDIVGLAGKKGHATLPEGDYRIVKVTISQEPDDQTRTGLDVVSSFAPTLDSEED